MSVLAYDAAKSVFTLLQTVDSCPADYHGQRWAAEVIVHPNGKLLYVSNRAHDSLAVLRIDPVNGKLSSVGFQTNNLKSPRHFMLDPTCQYLLAAIRMGTM